jgi:uncharacterized protein DUF4232
MTLMPRTARRLGAVTAIACAAVVAPAIALAAPAAPAAPVAHARQATPAFPFCQTPGLVEWMSTSGKAALGSTIFTMFFTNQSGHTCTLNGFPFLFAVGLRGHQIGRRAGFDRSQVPHTVVINNDQTATAQLKLVDVLNFQPPSTCRPVFAAGLKVFPPNQTRAKIIPFPFRACSTLKPFLTVGPVK